MKNGLLQILLTYNKAKNPLNFLKMTSSYSIIYIFLLGCRKNKINLIVAIWNQIDYNIFKTCGITIEEGHIDTY